MENHQKPDETPHEFWKNKLNAATKIVAPMVDQSELAWRLLSRRHGAQLCYTPMYHASVFIRDPQYRKDALVSCADDRPLIIQFCANDPEILLKAAKYAEPHCEAVDLNLGCPQAIAKRGHYGAFLQDEWDMIHKMVSLCSKELKIPITCKMRIFEDIDKTIKYAQMLEKAGCMLLTVHGRTREQKGPNTGVASWKHVKAVKDAIQIPVFANGNIQQQSDVERCMKETGVEGVMTAEGNLHNPALFEGGEVPVWDMAREYLDIVEQYPCPLSYIRGHLFKLFHHVFLRYSDLRVVLGNCKNITQVKGVVDELQKRSLCDMDNPGLDTDKCDDLPLPYWICQPYIRPTPEETEQRQKDRMHAKRHLSSSAIIQNELVLSNNKQKKLNRNPDRSFKPRINKFDKCVKCANPKGMRCQYELCRACCKVKMYADVLDCTGHKLYVKSKRKRETVKKEALASNGSTESNSSVSENNCAEECVIANVVATEVEIVPTT